MRTLYSRGQLTSDQFLQGLVETTKQYDEATSAVTKFRNAFAQQQRDAGTLLGSHNQNAVTEQLNTLDKHLRQPHADTQHPFGYSESEIARVNESLRGIIAAQQEKNRVDQAANAIIEQQTNLQDKLATQSAANAIAVQHGALSQQAANLQRLHGQAQLNQSQLASGTGGNPFAAALAGMDQFKTSAQEIQAAFEPVFKTLSDGFADSIGRAIVYSHNLGDAMRDVARSAIAELISGLVKMGIQFVLNATLGEVLGAASTVASAAQASVVATAWAPAAAMVSLASFGTNGAAADVAIATTNALTSGLALIPKLATGTNYVPNDMPKARL